MFHGVWLVFRIRGCLALRGLGNAAQGSGAQSFACLGF